MNIIKYLLVLHFFLVTLIAFWLQFILSLWCSALEGQRGLKGRHKRIYTAREAQGHLRANENGLHCQRKEKYWTAGTTVDAKSS